MNHWHAATIAEALRVRGYRWVAIQSEEIAFTPVAAFQTECHARGLLCGVWEAAVDFGSPARVAAGFDFYIGQVEGDGQYDRLAASLPSFRAAHPTMDAATVTTFAGFVRDEPTENERVVAARQRVKPFLDAGFACLAEVHAHESSPTIAGQIDYAQRVLQFPNPQVMVGLGLGATMADYPDFDPDRGDCVYGVEELLA